MKKILILSVLISVGVFSLNCGEDSQTIKSQKAGALYDRICEAIHNSNGFTNEWEAMKNKIYEDKDTVFLITSTDFQILIRKTTPLGAIVTDTTKTANSDSSKNGSWK